MQFPPFPLEEWLSRHEERARTVLAASGVAPLPVSELPGAGPAGSFGYGEVPARSDLTEAIARAYGVTASEVLVTIGGSEADALVALALVEPGDRVIVETPTYPPLAAVPQALGARVEALPRRHGDGWRLDLDTLEAKLRQGARYVVLTNANNPTGAACDARALAAVHAMAQEAGAYVLVDEAFRELAFSDLPCARPLGERFVVTNTLTKSWGLPGLRVGWILGPAELVARCRRIKAYLTIANPPLDQAVALSALARRDAILARNRRLRDDGWRAVEAWLARQPRLACVRPSGGNTCAPRLPDGVDDVKFAERLLLEHDTLVAPGSFLGIPGHLRIGFARPRDEVERGLAAIDRLLA
ncbi:MAG TPA: aminotransferase class I/II-fold pyridoxal phosphate-dependent enzyme [Candidatus Thermoplasmatota archaeon]|nr:aminotransferase class I/II-fold pyridoxal phosphate-dependent enzyme [Candidatus Thermoplasmatota archaeon]